MADRKQFKEGEFLMTYHSRDYFPSRLERSGDRSTGWLVTLQLPSEAERKEAGLKP